MKQQNSIRILQCLSQRSSEKEASVFPVPGNQFCQSRFINRHTPIIQQFDLGIVNIYTRYRYPRFG